MVKQRARPLPGLPRIRGGVSLGEVCLYDREESSPHTRGCFLLPVLRIAERVVFPAYAGVFLPRDGILQTWISLPRIRGGVSMKDSSMAAVVLSSPHTRGCFCRRAYHLRRNDVFPAYAGVFLINFIIQILQGGLPRIRGGVSIAVMICQPPPGSSPHTRGCFCHVGPRKKRPEVFPAYAGVFLR